MATQDSYRIERNNISPDLDNIEKAENIESLVNEIERFIENPANFLFGKVLDLPNVQQLAGTAGEKHLNLLKLFAYGTYQTYKNESEFLPQLSPVMCHKLRQLTIISLGQSNQIIPYDVLRKELDLEKTRDIEDLIIETILLNLIKGCIDQKKDCLEVFDTQFRDVRPEEFPKCMQTLKEWFQDCDNVLHSIDREICHANKLAKDSLAAQRELAEKIENAKIKDSNYDFVMAGKREDKSKRASSVNSSKNIRLYTKLKSNKRV